MDGSIQNLWNPLKQLQEGHQQKHHIFGELHRRDRLQWWVERNIRVSSAYPGFQHNVTERCHSSLASEVLTETRDGHLCANCDEPISYKSEKLLSDKWNDTGSASVALLRVCSKNKDLYRGVLIHEDILRRGLLKRCSNALATMYAKCGALAKARELLVMHKSRDVFSWTALIAGYAQQGKGRDALDCFECMQKGGLSPDAVTFASVLKACGSLGEGHKGKQIHEEIIRRGLLENDIVLSTALVDMYAMCGALEKAQQVLEQLPSRDVFTWSALIAGYVKHGQAEQAVHCFQRMRCEGLSPDALTFSCILKACGGIGAAEMGEHIHDEVAKQGLLRNNILLATALVDMHAKCGALAKAQQVLDKISCRDVVAWNALIAGFAQQGQGDRTMICLQRMQAEGLLPNAVTFACMLNACSNSGLVDEGHRYFEIMSTRYGIEPDSQHYACMVDLFGRAGSLGKAVGVIKEMPSSAYFAVWCAVLGACQKWGDVNIGRWAFEHAVHADKCDGAAHVLLANVYAVSGLQDDKMSLHDWWVDE